MSVLTTEFPLHFTIPKTLIFFGPSPHHTQTHTFTPAGAKNSLSLRETLHNCLFLGWPKMLLKLWNSFLEECNHILRQEPSPSLGKKTGAEVTFILSVTLSISWPIIAFPYPCYWKYKTKGNFLFCIEVTSFSCWSSPQPPEFKGFWGKNQPTPGEKMLEIWSY